MRLRRTLLCGLAIGLVASSGAANAASRPKPKTLCNMLTDVTGDGTWTAAKSDALDIVGADLATGKNELVAVLRMKTTANDSDPYREVFGFQWQMSTIAGGVRYLFTVRRGIGPANYIWEVFVGDSTLPAAAYTGKINPTSFEWHLKRSEVKALARPKLVFGTWTAQTKAFSSSADQADNRTNKYPDRALSCVKAL